MLSPLVSWLNTLLELVGLAATSLRRWRAGHRLIVVIRLLALAASVTISASHVWLAGSPYLNLVTPVITQYVKSNTSLRHAAGPHIVIGHYHCWSYATLITAINSVVLATTPLLLSLNTPVFDAYFAVIMPGCRHCLSYQILVGWNVIAGYTPLVTSAVYWSGRLPSRHHYYQNVISVVLPAVISHRYTPRRRPVITTPLLPLA